jgi:phospholipid/cholesterol/gamma-HCH transport system substrate-binding protein
VRRRRGGMNPFVAGAIALVVISCITYLGFAKRLPFRQDYEIQAVFHQANQIHDESPVRIAGVNVGKVKRVERGPGGTAIITMAISDRGRPVRADATVRIRPRIFLEGNFFLDLHPGTGRRRELKKGDTIPLAQTATPVQLDQILATLNASQRGRLQSLVREYGTALDRGGAQGLHDSFPHWEGAFTGAAVVAEAARGQRPDDLSRWIAASARVSASLASRRRELAELVGNFNATVRALASRQEDLGSSVAGLARLLRASLPALRSIDRSLPPLRAFVADARPAVREAPETLDLALPLLRQLHGLLGPGEVPALTASLRPALRTLTAVEPQLQALLGLVRPVTECVRINAVPTLKTVVDDDALTTGQPVWQELLHGMVGLASASQDFDGNGTAVRYHGGYGDQLFSTGQVPQVGQLFGLSSEPLIGSRPPWPGPGRQPPFRPDVPCSSQRPPSLAAGMSPAPRSRRVQPVPAADPRLVRRVQAALRASRRSAAASPPGRSGEVAAEEGR